MLDDVDGYCPVGYEVMIDDKLNILIAIFRDRLNMPVASISIVEMAVHGPLLHKMGDRAYLREHLRRPWEYNLLSQQTPNKWSRVVC